MGSRDRTEQAARKYCPSGASGACSHFWLCRLSQRLPWHWLQSEPYPECLEPAGAASRSAAARWHFQAKPLLPPAARQPPASTPGTSGTCCTSCRLSQCPAAVAGGLPLARGRCERTATLRPTPRPIDKPRPGWQMATAADQQRRPRWRHQAVTRRRHCRRRLLAPADHVRRSRQQQPQQPQCPRS